VAICILEGAEGALADKNRAAWTGISIERQAERQEWIISVYSPVSKEIQAMPHDPQRVAGTSVFRSNWTISICRDRYLEGETNLPKPNNVLVGSAASSTPAASKRDDSGSCT
jgi:hypothetical protein